MASVSRPAINSIPARLLATINERGSSSVARSSDAMPSSGLPISTSVVPSHWWTVADDGHSSIARCAASRLRSAETAVVSRLVYAGSTA